MLTLICGYPRAGKTTYAQRYSCPVIHLDECHSTAAVIARVRSDAGDVVVEGVYDGRRMRTALLSAYKGNGTRCIFLDTPLEVREKRAGRKIRMHNHPFPAPAYDEGWDEIIVVRDGEETLLER